MQNMTYEAPSLTVVGSVEELTAGTKTGNATDAAFPVHTPRGDITFS